ncbi:MAG: hypothetical protein IJL14_00125 [Selenomonadaceae bacterium]|nr:hypothetical protein [Selenomonadaceae bacterium]
MIPVLIGAAIGAAATYKFLEGKRDKKLHEETWTRYLSEDEVPPDILEKIRQKRLARLGKKILDC